MNKIEIVLAPDNNYIKHASVLIASVLANAKDTSKIRFWILDDGKLDEALKCKMQNIETKIKYEINFARIPDDMFKDFPEYGHITVNTWHRLKIASLLPDDVGRALYLDCDMIVESPLDELFEIDMGKNLVGGAIDCLWKKYSKNKMRPFKASHKYFNAGMLLVNLKLWREENTEKMIFDFLFSEEYIIKQMDQNVLNWCFEGRTLILPIEWNLQYVPILLQSCYWDKRQEYLKAIRNPKIIHFVSTFKPWNIKLASFNIFYKRYYKYLRLTDFRFANQAQEDEFFKSAEDSKKREFIRLLMRQFRSKPMYIFTEYFMKRVMLELYTNNKGKD